jgi:hypothetical protein
MRFTNPVLHYLEYALYPHDAKVHFSKFKRRVRKHARAHKMVVFRQDYDILTPDILNAYGIKKHVVEDLVYFAFTPTVKKRYDTINGGRCKERDQGCEVEYDIGRTGTGAGSKGYGERSNVSSGTEPVCRCRDCVCCSGVVVVNCAAAHGT